MTTAMTIERDHETQTSSRDGVPEEAARESECGRKLMKRPWLLMAVLLPTALSGCEIVADIFKTGVWVGVLLVLGFIGVIVWLVSKAIG